MRIVRDVLQHELPHRGTSVGLACEYLARVLRRRSLVFLLSDFFDTGYEQALRTLARRHEVVAVSLVDPLDLELPDAGIVELEDAERGGRLLLDTSDRGVRERYAAAAAERAEARTAALAAAGVDQVEVPLDGDHLDPIAAYFHRRASRQRPPVGTGDPR